MLHENEVIILKSRSKNLYRYRRKPVPKGVFITIMVSFDPIYNHIDQIIAVLLYKLYISCQFAIISNRFENVASI